MSSEPIYEWAVTVREWNRYGDKIIGQTPVTVRAASKSEVTAKVRQAFEARYDDFRKFWSHDWTLAAVNEAQQ